MKILNTGGSGFIGSHLAEAPVARGDEVVTLDEFNDFHLFKISTNALRFFTVYGPRRRPDMAIRKSTGPIGQGQPVSLYGDGSTERDCTYYTDIIAGIMASIEKHLGRKAILHRLRSDDDHGRQRALLRRLVPTAARQRFVTEDRSRSCRDAEVKVRTVVTASVPRSRGSTAPIASGLPRDQRHEQLT